MNQLSLNSALSPKRLEAFANHLRTHRNLSPLTIRAYLSDLTGLQTWLSTHTPPSQECLPALSPFEAYLEELIASRRYRDTTIKRKIASAKVYAKHLHTYHDLALPMLGLKGPRYIIEERLPVVMTDNEYMGFLRTLHELTQARSRNTRSSSARYRASRDRALFEVLFGTAARIGEMSSANVQDVSLENETILIRGKGRRQRLLKLTHPTTLHELETYLTERAGKRSPTEALFLNKLGRRLSIHAIERLFSAYLKAAGIARRITPHAVRHTVATGLLKNGADVRVVQAILGHSSIVTTQRYTHVNPTLIAESFSRYSPRNHVQL